MKCGALLPAYNEESHIAEVVQGLCQYVSTVIVVDDGSSDRTSEKAEQAGAQVIRHSHNQGKGAAIQTGLHAVQQSNLDVFFILDADAQHDWNEVPLFVQKMQQTGASIVIGNRMGNPANMPLIRKWTNQFTSWVVSRIAGQPISDSQCGYRLIHRRVLKDLSLTLSGFDAESEFLIQAARAGHKIEQVPIRAIYHGTEKSKINPFVDTLRFFKMAWKYRRSSS